MGGRGTVDSKSCGPSPSPDRSRKTSLASHPNFTNVGAQESGSSGSESNFLDPPEALYPAAGHNYQSVRTTLYLSWDHLSRCQNLLACCPLLSTRGWGKRQRNLRVPSPILEAEDLVTVETNPSQPNKKRGGRQGPRHYCPVAAV